MASREFEWLGETYRAAERIGLMPLMRFAKVAKSGVDSHEIEGLAAMYDLLRACVHPEDWGRFEEHADRQAADGDQILAAVGSVMALVATPAGAEQDRPTQPLSGSSAGSESTGPESTVTFLQRVSAGRPDLEVGLMESVAAQAAAGS